MKSYIIFILILAAIIPITVKLTLNSVSTGGAADTKPCMINFQSDSASGHLELEKPVPSSTMRPQQQINQEANETTQKINPFENKFDHNTNPTDDKIESSADIRKNQHVGQKCEFGLCLPGK